MTIINKLKEDPGVRCFPFYDVVGSSELQRGSMARPRRGSSFRGAVRRDLRKGSALYGPWEVRVRRRLRALGLGRADNWPSPCRGSSRGGQFRGARGFRLHLRGSSSQGEKH